MNNLQFRFIRKRVGTREREYTVMVKVAYPDRATEFHRGIEFEIAVLRIAGTLPLLFIYRTS